MSRSGSKVTYLSPSPKKKEHEFTTVQDLKKSSHDARKSITENTDDSRMKKKIKSVKVLPPAFERNLVEDPEDMRKSMEKSKEESKIVKN